MSLEITKDYNQEDKNWYISIEGEIDIETTKGLKNEIMLAYEEKEDNIVLDFQKVKYLDSTGLGSIIGAYGKIKENGHQIEIINPKEHIVKLLKITGLDQIFIK